MPSDFFMHGKLSDILTGIDLSDKSEEDIARMLLGLPVDQKIGADSIETIGKVVSVSPKNDAFTVYIF